MVRNECYVMFEAQAHIITSFCLEYLSLNNVLLSHRYQIAMIILIYLLPLLVMLITYSLIGQTLWGSEIPGEASDHYQNQIQAKRKVSYVILMQSLD